MDNFHITSKNMSVLTAQAGRIIHEATVKIVLNQIYHAWELFPATTRLRIKAFLLTHNCRGTIWVCVNAL